MNTDDTFNSNSDNKLPPELEARVVAWVLGEASAFEAAELTRLCAEQPELAVFKRRIEAINGLVRQAARPHAQAMELSPERRAKVLAAIGGDASATSDKNQTQVVKRTRFAWRAWALPMAACLALMGILAAVIIPTVGSVRETSRRSVELSDARQREQMALIERMEAESDAGVSVRERVAGSAVSVSMPMPAPMSALDLPSVGAGSGTGLGGFGGAMQPPEPTAAPARSFAGSRADGLIEEALATSIPSLDADGFAPAPVIPATPVSGPKKSQTVMITAGTPQEFTIREATETALWADQNQRFAGMDPFAPPPAPAPTELAARGRSQYIAGDLEGATRTFREMESLDASNPDAVHFLDRIAREKAEIGYLKRKQTRANQLEEVSKSWQRPSDAVGDKSDAADSRRLETVAAEVRLRKALADESPKEAESMRENATMTITPLERIIVPSVNFTGVPLSRALASLTSLGAEGTESGSPPLDIVLSAPAGSDPIINISLRNLSLKRILDIITENVGHEYEIRGNTVLVRPTPPATTLQTELIPVSREALAKMLGREALVGEETELLRKFFQQAGVDFQNTPDVAMAYDGAAVIVRQTSRNIERLKNVVRRYEAQVAKESLDTDLRAETVTAEQAVSTFSLHVSDASFRVAQAALARGVLPDASSIRPEEFYNAFDYGDPAPVAGEPVACRIEQAAHPFLQQRNLVRIAMKVPAAGRSASQPLRLTVLLDTSGSMEREDRTATVRAALGALASLLGPNDRVTLIGFARTPRLLAVNVPGDQTARLIEIAAQTPAEGGTNLELALQLAGEQARAHRLPAAQNRIVLLTDGAANLGDADPARLSERVEALRREGIAFDACGVVADGLDDGVLEALTRKGDGRYAIINSPDEADANFARQLAGAFRPAAKDVKVQVRFNPARVARYRLIGFEQHRLRTEDFRDNKIDAAELAAEEAANALYQVEVLPEGEGELGEVFVRFLDPSTGFYVERSWVLGYDAQASAFARATPSLQLAGSAAFLAEKLRGGELAGQVRLDEFAPVVNGLGAAYPGAPRVREFIEMFSQTRRITGE